MNTLFAKIWNKTDETISVIHQSHDLGDVSIAWSRDSAGKIRGAVSGIDLTTKTIFPSIHCITDDNAAAMLASFRLDGNDLLFYCEVPQTGNIVDGNVLSIKLEII